MKENNTKWRFIVRPHSVDLVGQTTGPFSFLFF